jgi:hypothetical protein
MTAKEVFKEITSIPKWYAGYISAQYASNIKRQFVMGKLSDVTLNRLFDKFGYSQNEITWKKKS